MGNIITSVATYTGKQAEFQETFVLKLAQNPLLASLGFRIEQDIQSKKTFYKTGRLNKITKASTGCTRTETATGVPIEAVVLQVYDMEAEMSQCKSVFDATIYEAAMKKGFDIFNLEGTQIQTLLLEIFGDAVANDLYRQVFLNDSTLTNSDYTAYDGVYKRLKAGALAVDGTIRVAASISDADLASGAIVATLDTYYNAQPSPLKYNVSNAMKRFMVTDPVYRAWEQKLTELGSLESSKVQLVDGIEGLKFRGIPMVNLTQIDEYILQDFSTTSPASASTSDNRIILTNPENHLIGTDLLTDTANAEFWYERKDKTNYARLNYKAGYNYIDGKENVIGGW
jgi:hypothetical protein